MNVLTIIVAGSLGFGLIMLAIGFTAGAWYTTGERHANRTKSAPAAGNVPSDILIERATYVTHELIRLTDHVASDVSNHSSKVEAITADLQSTTLSPNELLALLETAPSRLVAANLELQQQLAAAKQQIESQADQLKVKESEARTDPLTTLYNRRAFDEEVTRQLSLCTRKSTSFSLLLLDIDHFKRFNDLHGHQIGDKVLCDVSTAIVRQLRCEDMAFRYGGEEFAVILPYTSARDARIVAQRIRQSIEETKTLSGGKVLRVTASIGLTSAVRSDQAESLVQRADAALYSAKQSGRNCVRWHNGTCVVAEGEHAEAFVQNTSKPLNQVISITALNTELTKQVCESRRNHTPLTLVSVQLDRDVDSGTAQSVNHGVMAALIDAVGTQLHREEFLVPLSATELLLIASGLTRPQTIQRLDAILRTDDGKRFLSTYGRCFRYEACELEPLDTAEELLLRTREHLMAANAT